MSFAKETPFRQQIRPGFFGDFLNREHVLPGGIKLKASTFNGADAVQVVVGAAGALADANTVPVDALSGDIPKGTVLNFGAADSKKFAKLTANAVSGDVSIAVEDLPTALVDNDTAFYNPPSTGKRVPSGTPVFIDQELLETSAAIGAEWESAANGTAVLTTDLVRIVAFDVLDVDDNNDADLLRKGTLIRVNHMYWDTLDDTVKAKIRADYEVTVGAPGQEVPAS